VLEGADDLRTAIDPSWAVGAACGFGPSLTVDGRTVRTQVSGTVRELLRGEPMAWTACGPDSAQDLLLPGGHHLVDAVASAEFVPQQLALVRPEVRDRLPVTSKVGVAARGDVLDVAARTEPGLLVMPHNANAGWSASDASGQSLASVRANGWQQAWVLPPGGPTTVRVTFTPQRWYAAGLALGALSLLGVVGLAMTTRRRQGGVPLRPSRTAALALPVALGTVLVVNAGAVGAAAGLAAVVVLSVGRGRPRLGWLGCALACTTAVVTVAREPWQAGGAAVGSATVALAAWTAVSLAVLAPTSGAPLRRGSESADPASRSASRRAQERSAAGATVRDDRTARSGGRHA
jgi:arabinofuranan 3-O-arabinosyltransferase